MTEKLGLTEAVSIALGGMIGGGIFAVLGVVAKMSGSLSWAAFVVAGVVATCAGYSYVQLNRLSDSSGGSVTYIEEFLGNPTFAGMAGWTLLVGYVGSMAMYAFAFGSFFERLVGVHHVAGLPLRPVVSVVAVAGFVGLNFLGAQATGTSENVMVGLKVGVLLLFGLWGLYYGSTHGKLEFGRSQLGLTVGPVMAAAVSFVAFQGWQLLTYDQDDIEDVETILPKAIYVSIPIATFVYVVVAVVTTSLAKSSVVQNHPETALAVAARPFMGSVGFTLIAVAALFSTGSAINATLFSSARFAKGMLQDDLLPSEVGRADADGAPARTLLVLGALTAAFTTYGSLRGITSFASLSFIVVFGAMSYLAFAQRDREEVRAAVPAVGVVGTALFLPLMLWHLYADQRSVFFSVVAIAVAVVGVELLYFEREKIEDGIESVERWV
ncbi:APC family permease [Halorussus limi]|uniref:APC family permease n=1 Tax=Halorussus limi TaxID=2938695 RepID=A0A8U0HQJ1_9EURY|nr:APC family permease [Halorussus limi]UPV73131.1 APC family permease [Halorussus limi]